MTIIRYCRTPRRQSAVRAAPNSVELCATRRRPTEPLSSRRRTAHDATSWRAPREVVEPLRGVASQESTDGYVLAFSVWMFVVTLTIFPLSCHLAHKKKTFVTM